MSKFKLGCVELVFLSAYAAGVSELLNNWFYY